MSGLPCNVGGLDRLARAAIGAVLVLAVLFGALGGGAGWIAGLVGLVMLATAGMRFCPLYTVIGLKTCAD